jgi:hypothetical protein
MGVSRGPSPIATDGLIFAADAGNPRCYTSGSATATDLIGGLTCTFNNGSAPSIQPYPNYWDFDGSDDYINITTPFTSLSTLSLTTWLAPDTNGGGYESPFSGRSGATGNDYSTGINVDMMNASSATFNQLNIEGAGRIGYEANEMTSSIPFGTWVHVGITINTTLITLYINSIAEGTRARSDVAMSLEYMQIGARYYSSAVRGYWDGKIGPVMMYNKVLSATEILQNYNATKNRFGL